MAGGSLTLAQFIAFNEQLAAFARLGVPLQDGLRELARTESGRLRQLCSEVGTRIERGESLEQALGALREGWPPTFQLMIQAGTRTGDLAGALAATARSAKRIEQIRRLLALASVYPLLLIVLAWGLTFAFVFPLLSMYEHLYKDFRVGVSGWEQFLFDAARGLQGLWWVAPAAIGVMVALWLVRGGIRSSSVRWWGRLIPGLSAISRDSEIASACELLAAGVEHGMPLEQSLPLVTSAIEDPTIHREFERYSAQRAQGVPSEEVPRGALPGLLGWLLSQRGDPAQMASGLRQLSVQLQDRVRTRVRWLTLRLPALVAVGTGAVVVGAYTLLVFGPMIQFWKDLVV